MNDMTTTPELPEAPEAQPEQQASLLSRWRERIEYQAMSLGLVCALVALSLLLGHAATEEQIAHEQLQDRMAVLRQVLPDALYDNSPLQEAEIVDDPELGPIEVYPAKRGGQLSALAFQVSPIGYGGPIDLFIAIDTQGQILGVRVLAHKETPGLADKIEITRSDWIKGFDGLSLANTPMAQWAVKKDGGQFDQFAGATITPRAIVKGVVQALQFQARQSTSPSPEEAQP